jgi:putative membrane protein
MRVVTLAVRLVLFILLLVFAAKNTEPATLHFLFDVALSAPLIVLLFAFFVAGALFGVLALLGTLLRQRREISRLQREVRREGGAVNGGAAGHVLPPMVDG